MKLFQKLLLAPAALGLLAPVAASAADLASAGMNSYVQQNDLHNFRVWADQNQVTSVTQLSDVKPTDWAYQALSNLVDKYGCVAGYPNGTYKGGQALTRYEAAALLNACLDRVTEITDEIQRLQQDFAKELEVIKGRVGALEKKVGKLEATQFSTTTKLQGDTFWTIGANAFGGGTANRINGLQRNASLYGGTVFNYDLRLNLNTSFTGKDLLYTRLRSGNYGNSPFIGNPYSLQALDRAFAPTGGANVFNLDRLYYRFPLGTQFTAGIGPRARNTEFLAILPFYYGDFSGLDFFTLHGAPGTYNKATGGLAALIWKQDVKKGKPFFAVSTSYVAPSADNGNTGTGDPGSATQGGIFQNNSAGSWLTQIGY
ncbi:MAG: iron uptake porin, partial [Vulcanococcus sp.]